VKICYVDEAGCVGSLPSASSDIQPTLVIGGIIISYDMLHRITNKLLALKYDLFPGQIPSDATFPGRILPEIKGADIRKAIADGGRNKRRHAFRYLDGILDICHLANAKLIGRVWIKGIGKPFNGRSVYTSSIQAIATYFQDYLTRENDFGVMVVDSRLKALNSQVAHSIFTQKFKGTGDSYNRIVELPSFGHSDNHAGLQLSDTISSAIITPIAIHSYCREHIQSVHVRPRYDLIKERYASRLSIMQHRYQEAHGRWFGGLVGRLQKPLAVGVMC
jgi:hypothetical protein